MVVPIMDHRCYSILMMYVGLLAASSASHNQNATAVVNALVKVEIRVRRRDSVHIGEMREVLRRAASFLCRSTDCSTDVLDLFVRIPFAVFNKQAIKLGLSLWMGVIKENPRMEPRLLVEIMENWISTVRGRIGIFSRRMR